MINNNMKYTEWEKSIGKQIAGYDLALKYKSLGVIIQRNKSFDMQADNIIARVKKNNHIITTLKNLNAN